MSQPQPPESSTPASPFPHRKSLEPQRLQTSRRGQTTVSARCASTGTLRRTTGCASGSWRQASAAQSPGVLQHPLHVFPPSPLWGQSERPSAAKMGWLPGSGSVAVRARRGAEDTAPGRSPPCALICWQLRSPRPAASQRRRTSPLPDSAAGGGAAGSGGEGAPGARRPRGLARQTAGAWYPFGEWGDTTRLAQRPRTQPAWSRSPGVRRR